MSPPPVDAVCFDFGSTLFGSPPLDALIAEATARAGRPAPADVATALAARILAAAMDPVEMALGRDLDATLWAARWAALYAPADEWVPGAARWLYTLAHAAETWRPYPGTAATLEGLAAAGVRVAIVSNTGWDVRVPFAAHGLDVHVDAFVLSCEVGVAKPDPAIFLAALELVGSTPERSVMVGDDPVADVGAVAMGMRVLLLPRCPPDVDNGVSLALRLAAGAER